MRDIYSPVKHATAAARKQAIFHLSESDRIKPTAMSDDHAGKKEGDEPPEDDDTGEKDLPPPWAAAMAREIVAAIGKASQAKERVSQGTSPGTSGKSQSHTHTIAGKSRRAELGWHKKL